jgi:hypothetical protein
MQIVIQCDAMRRIPRSAQFPLSTLAPRLLTESAQPVESLQFFRITSGGTPDIKLTTSYGNYVKHCITMRYVALPWNVVAQTVRDPRRRKFGSTREPMTVSGICFVSRPGLADLLGRR